MIMMNRLAHDIIGEMDQKVRFIPVNHFQGHMFTETFYFLKKHVFTHTHTPQVANTPYINSPPLPPPDSRSSTPTQIGDESRPTSVSRNLGDDDETRVAQRSRWQAVLLEAGGLSAALSEESMQRLKYCLHWLQVRQFYFI